MGHMKIYGSVLGGSRPGCIGTLSRLRRVALLGGGPRNIANVDFKEESRRRIETMNRDYEVHSVNLGATLLRRELQRAIYHAVSLLEITEGAALRWKLNYGAH